MSYGVNPLTGKPGPVPQPPRDGDKIQARVRINQQVRKGERPHPNTIPCADCGHVWKKGERRHEYDHYLGYAAQNHDEVEVVCTICHNHRDNPKSSQTHCIHGHEFTPENTIIKSSGTRACRTCFRIYDRKRRGPEYWREEYKRRKAKK